MLKFGPYSYLNSGQKMISLYCVTYANSNRRARATGQKLADKLSVKHKSLTARTSNKLFVLRRYCYSNTYVLASLGRKVLDDDAGPYIYVLLKTG